MAGSTEAKNHGGTPEKPSEKHEMAKPTSVFHEVFLEYHQGFFAEVDPATQGEHKHTVSGNGIDLEFWH